MQKGERTRAVARPVAAGATRAVRGRQPGRPNGRRGARGSCAGGAAARVPLRVRGAASRYGRRAVAVRRRATARVPVSSDVAAVVADGAGRGRGPAAYAALRACGVPGRRRLRENQRGSAVPRVPCRTGGSRASRGAARRARLRAIPALPRPEFGDTNVTTSPVARNPLPGKTPRAVARHGAGPARGRRRHSAAARVEIPARSTRGRGRSAGRLLLPA